MDSDSVWKKIGSENPFFGVLSDERYRGAELNDDLHREFYATGEALMDQIAGRLGAMYHDFVPQNLTAIDFGCGVGRLLVPMARRCRKVWGIDVAPPMIERTRAAAEQAHLSNFELVPLPDHVPADAGINWLNSSVVFQHIPIERGYRIFDQLLSRMGTPGFLSVQFTIFKDPDVLKYVDQPLFVKQQEIGEYVSGGVTMAFQNFTADNMAMYDYDMDQIIAIMVKHGFLGFFVDMHRMGLSHSALILARRG